MRKIAMVLLVLSTLGCNVAQAADAGLMLNIMLCESGFRHDAVGDDGVSRGLAQFRKETFYEFAAMARSRGEWRFGKPRWLDPQQQVFLLEWGIDNGYGNRWTCFRLIKKRASNLRQLGKLHSHPTQG